MDDLRRLADAVLYEGYLLWPYRRSALKNQRRWTFGGVFPRGHSDRHPDDRWQVGAQVLLDGPEEATVDAELRFLQVVHRQALHAGAPVDELVSGGERVMTWDEATERTAEIAAVAAGETRRVPIDVREGRAVEALAGGDAIVRSWRPLAGWLEVAVGPDGDGRRRVAVRVANTAPWGGGPREEEQRRALCSAHVVLRAHGGGRFVSATETPSCRQEGLWPVLVGAGDDTVLAAPIILEDHPRIAPESPGDLFDGGEIDQLLTLSLLSLTEEEKAEMRASDPKARAILDRTEALSEDEILRLNGAIREFGVVRDA
jgi:hydrogenase maturation protease